MQQRISLLHQRVCEERIKGNVPITDRQKTRHRRRSNDLTALSVKMTSLQMKRCKVDFSLLCCFRYSGFAGLHGYPNMRKQMPTEPTVEPNFSRLPPAGRGRHGRQHCPWTLYWCRVRCGRRAFPIAYAICNVTADDRSAKLTNFRRLRLRIRYKTHKNLFSLSQDLLERHWRSVSNRSGRSVESVNDGIRYLLTYIDVFSKRAWAVPDRKSPLETSPKLSKRFWQIKCAPWYTVTKVHNFLTFQYM